MNNLKPCVSFLFTKELSQLLVVAVSTGLLAAVIVYARITDQAIAYSASHKSLPNNLKADASTTIAVVRVLQGVLSATSSIAFLRSCTYLQWILISRSQGLGFGSLLATAPSTTDIGRARLIFSSSSRLPTRILGLLCIVATTLLWLSGLVLFLQTSMVVVYDTAHSYEAVAGVGPFNASLVDPFMNRINSPTSGYDYNGLPYSYYSVVYNLVSNPVFANSHAPVKCSGPTCVSYVLSGGIFMSAQWQPVGYQTYPLVSLPSVPVMQLDFDTQPMGNNFTEMADCDLIGAERVRIGVRLCLKRSMSRPGAVEAGLFICKEGVSGGVCNTQYSSTPNLTAIVSFHRRRADILASRTNSTILAVSDLTTASIVPIDEMDLANYRKALRWLLDYVAADIPAPSAIIENFWTGQSQLATEHLAYGYLAQHFHSILAFPVWFFNVNNFGNIDLPSNDLNAVSPLSEDFLTTAHIVAPYTLIRFKLAMVIAFAVAQGLVLLFAWILLIWAMSASASLPRISSYPLFDLVFKAETAINARSDELWDADDAKVETMLQGLKVNRNAI